MKASASNLGIVHCLHHEDAQCEKKVNGSDTGGSALIVIIFIR